MTAREMRPEDVEAVAELERKCFSAPWSAKAFLDALGNENALYLVAEDDGRIVGCCGIWQSFEEGEITNVAVEESSRGRGIAGRLLTELFVMASRRGITAFTLEVRQGNVPAVRLYERLGFETAGIRKNFYEKPTENALVMWKR